MVFLVAGRGASSGEPMPSYDACSLACLVMLDAGAKAPQTHRTRTYGCEHVRRAYVNLGIAAW